MVTAELSSSSDINRKYRHPSMHRPSVTHSHVYESGQYLVTDPILTHFSDT
jgi:hypothetical protein